MISFVTSLCLIILISISKHPIWHREKFSTKTKLGVISCEPEQTHIRGPRKAGTMLRNVRAVQPCGSIHPSVHAQPCLRWWIDRTRMTLVGRKWSRSGANSRVHNNNGVVGSAAYWRHYCAMYIWVYLALDPDAGHTCCLFWCAGLLLLLFSPLISVSLFHLICLNYFEILNK